MVGDPGGRRQPVFATGAMEPVWFRPGLLNLCFGALDVHVVRGRASDPAVLTDGRTLDFATVLEQVAALAGALRLLGVTAGAGVRLALDDPYDELLVMLACSRLGAVHGDVADPALLVTSDERDDPAARVRLLRGVPLADPERDVAWELAYKAGRDDPAPCAELDADAPVWVYAGRPVSGRNALADDSRAGWFHAMLTAGLRVELGASP